jgi:hypothetical protein
MKNDLTIDINLLRDSHKICINGLKKIYLPEIGSTCEELILISKNCGRGFIAFNF